MGEPPRGVRIPPPQYRGYFASGGSVPFTNRKCKNPRKNMGAFFFGKAIKNSGVKIFKKKDLVYIKEDLNKELISWYQTIYIYPNCYSIMDDPKIMKKSDIYFTLERPRNRKPMEPKRVLHKVRIWNGTPTQKFFGKKKRV